MKITVNLLLIFMFLSCNSNKTDVKTIEQNDTLIFTSTESELNQVDTNISIEGFWIDEKYYKELIITKSPKDLEIPNISCFQIPKSTKQITRFIYGFYESGGDLMVKKNEANFEFWGVESNKKTNQIEIISKEIIKVNNQRFIKLKELGLINDTSEVKILENLLFLGKYSNSNGEFVEFKSNGELIGFENFNQYDVPIEIYSEGIENNIFFVSKNGNEESEFGFKFNNDSLFIYNLRCLEFNGKDNICYKNEIINLKTVLVKVH